MKKAMSVLLAMVAVLGLTATVSASPGNGAGGVTGAAFYVDGELYRTVGTPTDLSGTKAPTHSYDAIYVLGSEQAPVAEAAPGDRGYNGGRWQAHLVAFNSSYAATLAAHDADANGVLDTLAEVESALADGSAAGASDVGVVASFECPVIKL